MCAMPLLCRPCDRVVTLCLCVGCVGACAGVCGWLVWGVCAGVQVVDPDGGFQGVWRVCVCHSCTCDMRDTCTTATEISQESAVQTLRGGREPRRKFLEERTRDTRRPRFRRGEIGDFCHPGRNRRLSGGAKIGDFCHFGKSATFVPGGKRGPAAILINAYSGDFCHPVLSNAVAPEPLVYHSGTKCAILGPFWAPPPFFGHFWPFWAILGIFGPFWPFLAPPAPPAPIFGPEFPRPSPKTSPRTSAKEKNSRRTSRRRKFPAAHSAQMSAEHFPAAHSAQNSPAQICTQIRRTKSAHNFRANSPAHICAQIPRTQILRKRLRRKIG